MKWLLKTNKWIYIPVLTVCILYWTSLAQAQTIPPLIERLEVGQPVYYENLTIIPIYNTDVKWGTHYTILDEALDHGWLEITELRGGNVPEVMITNRSNRYIYIMGGEIISGGKQDRIVSRDVLLGPKAVHVVVPVYCTEQGRWQVETPQFYSKKNLGTWNMRSTAQYSASGAQSSLWADITSSARKLGVDSRTGAYQAAYESKGVIREIKRHEEHFRNIPNLAHDTVGVIVAIGNNIISVDIFAHPDLFKTMWPKILKSSALAAVSDQGYGQVTEQDAVRILRQIHDAVYDYRPAIHLGQEIAAYNNGVNVYALAFQSQILHVAAFPIMQGTPIIRTNDYHERRIPVMQRSWFR